MIELRTLGAIDLCHADGTSVAAVLAQPRRLALLIYLVKAGAGAAPTFHRRDALLALFWPEADTDSARGSLKVAIHFLRRALGDGVIVSRGAGELGVSADAIACDAWAFERAGQEGRLAEAAALYRGEFLPAFHISGAPEFDDWVAQERARLSARYRQTLEQLARAAEQAGDTVQAAALWRRVVSTAPLDTAAVLALMRALDCVGDRAGALVAAREHEQRVRAELDADVDPSVRALEHQLRRGPLDSSSASRGYPTVRIADEYRPSGDTRASPNASADDEAEPEASPDTAAAASLGTIRPPRSRAIRLGRGSGVTVLASVIAIVGMVFLTSREPSSAAPVQRERVLVAPLENRTGDARLDALGAMAADWIAQGLQETALVDVVDPLSAIASRRRVDGEALGDGVKRADALARAAGAGSVVWGAIYRSGDSIFFRAQVSDVAAGKLRVALNPVVASAVDPRPGVEQLRQQVAGALAAQFDRRVSSVSDPTGRLPALEAYREYALGLEKFIKEGSGYREAIPHFAAATRLDTTFYSPLVWLEFAFGNLGRRKQADSVVALLAAHRTRLAPLDRFALDVFEAQARRDWGASLTAELEAARLSPGSEWSYNAGSDLVAEGRAREALRYLRQIDPEHGWARDWFGYWSILAAAHHRLGEYREELAVAQRFGALHPESRNGRYFLGRALVSLGRWSDAERQAQALLAMPAAQEERPLYAPLVLGKELAGHGDTAAARRVFELAVAWPRSTVGAAWAAARSPDDSLRRPMRGDLACVLYELGRWHEAELIFEQLSAGDTSDVGLRFLATIAAVRQGNRAAAATFGRWLSDAESRGSLESRWLPVGGRGPAVSPEYVRAHLALVLGDTSAALNHLRGLRTAKLGAPSVFQIHRESDWRGLLADPEVQALLKPAG
jgi:DNA-binding SARP family transcriptional activator